MQGYPNFSDERVLEKYSSAFTLSDMEVFVFPELLYPLVIANIMSPIIWAWLDDPWFNGITRKSFIYKVNRIKQYIMDHFIFNLDLETWGLTEKGVEIDRFSDFIDMNILTQSNALFGYEGDKYYFDMDIRRHFGLDKYTTDTIPYWKTETIEAMRAFKYKPGFTTGAGECVSLSALYAAALFIIGKIPLENIFLMATPLHSQNFIDIEDGLLTNNRRIVTRNMWFNGTEITGKARRAMEKEKVTIISHLSGYIHHIYDTATIQQESFTRFTGKLKQYLKTELSVPVFINFLRSCKSFQSCFQFRQLIDGKMLYIETEKIFKIEHSLHQSFTDQFMKDLIPNIPVSEFSTMPLKNRILFQDVKNSFAKKKIISNHEFQIRLRALSVEAIVPNPEMFENHIEELFIFIQVEPKLPFTNKVFISTDLLDINTSQSREDILEKVLKNAGINEVANLSLYAYRYMDKINWKPFIKAALERNPVSILGLTGKTISEASELLSQFSNESIYDSNRLSLPDEVWNFQRGDGIEKAILLANFILSTDKKADLNLTIEYSHVTLEYNNKSFYFTSNKSIRKNLKLSYCGQEHLCKVD